MVYTANWGIIWYLPPIKGTRKLHWLYNWVVKPNYTSTKWSVFWQWMSPAKTMIFKLWFNCISNQKCSFNGKSLKSTIRLLFVWSVQCRSHFITAVKPWKFQPIVHVNWWFGFLGYPDERDCYLTVPLESQAPIEPPTKNSYFPLNPGCLLGILK